MRNLVSNGDFRNGSVDVKIGNGTGTVTTSASAIGAWILNVDETDVATNKYIRIRNIGVSAAVAASKVTEPPQEVVGDSLLLIDLESGPLRPLGTARTGFAKVAQTISSSPKALSNKYCELNFFVYSAVAGVFGVRVDNINVYAGGTVTTQVVNEAVQLRAGWNRVQRVFLHPNVLDTDPANGAYVSGSHVITLDADQGLYPAVSINQLTTVAVTGVYFGLQQDAEFDRVEQILRANTAANLGTGAESTTTGAIALDLTPGKAFDTVVLTGNPTFSTANRTAGSFKSLRIDSNGSSRTLTFNASWKWLGTDYSAGATLASGKIAVLSLTCYGSAETDVVAVYVAQP